ncbi:hypothetical protein [Chondromyces apiculatus]|uniref:Uncharacterized protein n=1 Tax=Chondromyces apiculatus DSM 436 TaxID=1192034 RepID=A0A017SX64_9BACT|nr:hypothetical protein [Chondromyces apiculatus]EYF01372.1 Hypothetical protein CAP_8414 [Chondromyces apiculatus DSM 436]
MTTRQMQILSALGSGLVGAAVLTAVHQIARALTPNAPRMDVLGRRAITKTLKHVGITPPRGDTLQRVALAGDLVSNSLYFALAGLGAGRYARHAPGRGLALGLLAGLGAVVLPPKMHLGRWPSRASTATKAMTVAWYTAGGLAAGTALRGVRQSAWV